MTSSSVVTFNMIVFMQVKPSHDSHRNLGNQSPDSRRNLGAKS